jgi:arylsulfatase A-like enzyme/tetratricopeptide (TPR) repeat protein
MSRLWKLMICLALLSTAMLGCGGDDEEGDDGNGRVGGNRPIEDLNVVLITVDGLGADQLGCYGAEGAVTPNLDSLTEEGVRFARAYTPVPLSTPAHASVMTGAWPAEHGLHGTHGYAMNPDVATLAEMLTEHGHACAGFAGGFPTNSRFGLGRGMDPYVVQLSPDQRQAVKNLEHPARAVASRAAAWIQQNGGQPFFCFINLHDPATPHQSDRVERVEPEEAYREEISRVDTMIGAFLRKLTELDLREKTLVIVAGTHGEAFGEHDEWGHGPLVYNTTLHVPLLMSLPGVLEEGKTDDRVASLVDIAPTVLATVGADRPDSVSGHDLLGTAPTDRHVYAESEYLSRRFDAKPVRCLVGSRWKYIDGGRPELYDLRVDPDESENIVADHSKAAGDLRARLDAIRSDMTVRAGQPMYDPAKARTELIQLGVLAETATAPADDPQRQLADAPDIMPFLEGMREVEEYQKQGRLLDASNVLRVLIEAQPNAAPLRRKMLEVLAAAEGLHQGKSHLVALLERDPLSREAVRTYAAIILREGQAARAERLLLHALKLPLGPEEVAAPGVGSVTERDILRDIGVARIAQKKLDQAIEPYAELLRRDPTDEEAHRQLVRIHFARGRHDQAIRHCQALVAISPNSASARSDLATALAASGRLPDAVAQHRQALALDPAHRYSIGQLGSIFLAHGHYAQAAQVWAQGLQNRPRDVQLAQRLAWLLATCPEEDVADPDEAIHLGRQIVNLTGGKNVGALDTLAVAQARAGRFEAAIENARKALELADAAGQDEQAELLKKRIELYRQEKPYIQEPTAPATTRPVTAPATAPAAGGS